MQWTIRVLLIKLRLDQPLTEEGLDRSHLTIVVPLVGASFKREDVRRWTSACAAG